MDTVGSYEAKTHLPELLNRVALGEKIMITKRGKPVAMLVPPATPEEPDVREVVRQMQKLREGNPKADAKTIRQFIDAGRRF